MYFTQYDSVIHQHFQVTCFLIYIYCFNKFPLFFRYRLYHVWLCYAKNISNHLFLTRLLWLVLPEAVGTGSGFGNN